MFRRVLAFITNAGARRATQFRLLLWRGKDQKTSSKKKVDRASGREGERERAAAAAAAAGGSAAHSSKQQREQRETKKAKKNFKNQKL